MGKRLITCGEYYFPNCWVLGMAWSLRYDHFGVSKPHCDVADVAKLYIYIYVYIYCAVLHACIVIHARRVVSVGIARDALLLVHACLGV